MRTIKFRVFDKRKKEMHEVVSIWGFPETHHITVPNGDSVLCLFDDFQLMQFTGLKDKKGVDIYEGDILKFPFEMGIAFVISDSFRFAVESPVSGAVDYEEEEVLSSTTIIGNIYENPELIWIY